jgi:hypothetical protein
MERGLELMKNLFCKTVLMAFSLTFVAAGAQAGLNLADGYASGQWWNPARDGEGFYVEVIDTGGNLQIAVAMYSYNEAGEQLWLVGNIAIEDGDQGATVPVFLIEGPVWGTSYDPADKSTTDFGSIVVQFPTCDSALFNVNSNVAGLESGSYSLVRATDLVGIDCVEPPPPGPPPPETDITPGLWTGEGVCFFVNAEGTKLVESDQCNAGNAFSANVEGIQIDADGRPDLEDCIADVFCDGAWDIYIETNPQSGIETTRASCINTVGGIGHIIFDTGERARVTVYQGVDLDGRLCYGGGENGFDTAPAQ